jgi:hypothetical protein
LIVTEQAVAMNFEKISKKKVYIVQGSRPFRMACELDTLPRRQVSIDLFCQLFCFLFQPLHFIREIDALLFCETTQFLDFIL